MDDFSGLKKQLDLLEWPGLYFFKFITPTKDELIKKIISHFDEKSEVHLKASKNGTFTSISIKEIMFSSEDVIAIYKEIGQIKGVIIL